MTPTRTAHAVPRPPARWSLLAAGLLALLALLFTSGTAAAHDVVTGSDPADGATVATAPTQVSVTFDEAPQPGLATLTVVGPDGAHHEQGPVTTQGDVVSVPVGPLPAAGAYEIGYRIVSSDGHPVSGSIAFTLTNPSPAGTAAPGTPAAAAPAAPADPAHAGHADPTAPPSPAASASDDPGGGVPAWVFVVIALVVVAGAVALVLRRRA
ncbi:MAG: pcoC [Actinomycetospora sp.]|jgi:methionine-rich copper-binding protein CopC|nr:pcoC [Actinomycetospora sp.]